jgi:hypothetical protein
LQQWGTNEIIKDKRHNAKLDEQFTINSLKKNIYRIIYTKWQKVPQDATPPNPKLNGTQTRG